MQFVDVMKDFSKKLITVFYPLPWTVHPAVDDFIDGALHDCAVGNIVWSTLIAFDKTKYANEPTTMADFFNVEKFPGKRGMRKSPKAMLEMALMGDGVPAEEVYDLL
jgi:putative spermidine/putrescine transport system substrate-binding protein